ncbi:glycosyltransferase [Pseudoscourfieldia marina]
MGTCDDYNYFGDTLMWCRHIQGAGGLFFPGFSGQPPISFNTLFTTAKKERKTWIHFPRVIIGGGGLGLWLHYQETPHTPKYMDGGSRGSRGFGVHMWALHQHYYKRFQLNAFCCVMPQHRFTIIDKKGGKGGNTRIGQRRIGNADSVKDWLIGEFPNIPVDIVSFQGMTWREQVTILSKTSILITPSGSVSFRLLFLPKGAHAIIIGWPQRNEMQFAESDVWFRYQAFVHIWNYEVMEGIEFQRHRNASQGQQDTILTKDKILGLVRNVIIAARN